MSGTIKASISNYVSKRIGLGSLVTNESVFEGGG